MFYWEKQVKENAIVKHGKVRTYYSFKLFFKKEVHLQCIKSRDVRNCCTQFRTSAHKLAIERGRYSNIKAGERFCKYCQAKEVEDEIQFLMKCQMNRMNRTNYFHILRSRVESEENIFYG